MGEDPTGSNSGSSNGKPNAELETLRAGYDQQISDLRAQLDIERKRPFVARILDAKLALGQIKDDTRAAEEQRLFKAPGEDLQFIASELEAVAKAKKEVLTVSASSAKNYRFKASSATGANECYDESWAARLGTGNGGSA